MYSKFLLLSFFVLLFWMSFVVESKYIPPNGSSADQVEVDYDQNNPSPPARGGPLARKFTAWMNFIKNIWTQGNWENGGPPDFARFIGDQVHKLVSMLDQDKRKR